MKILVDENIPLMTVQTLQQPNRKKIHQRVIQAVKRLALEERFGLLVVMRDVVQSVWRASNKK